MKTLAILLSLAAAVTVQVRADVLIYNFKQTNTWTGGGTKFKQVISGRMVLDVDTGSITVFSLLPNMRFQVDCPRASIAHVIGVQSVPQSAWFLNGTAYDQSNQLTGIMQYFLRGNDTSFLGDLVSPLSYRAPKLLRGTYQASYRAADTSVFVGEGSLVVSYAQGATFNANLNGLTATEFVQTFRQTWVSKGWAEVTPDAPCSF